MTEGRKEGRKNGIPNKTMSLHFSSKRRGQKCTKSVSTIVLTQPYLQTCVLQASGAAPVVGAIDFGTTNSGWAYSFLHDFKSEPAKAYVRQWNSGTLVTEKTPTCALISPDGQTLEGFGYDAENKYKDLVEKGRHRGYYYFRRFKMSLNKEVGSSYTNEPRCEKTGIRGFLPDPTQTGLYSYRRWLEA